MTKHVTPSFHNFQWLRPGTEQQWPWAMKTRASCWGHTPASGGPALQGPPGRGQAADLPTTSQEMQRAEEHAQWKGQKSTQGNIWLQTGNPENAQKKRGREGPSSDGTDPRGISASYHCWNPAPHKLKKFRRWGKTEWSCDYEWFF